MSVYYSFRDWMAELHKYLRINSPEAREVLEGMPYAECQELFDLGLTPEAVGRLMIKDVDSVAESAYH